ncbi:tetratricopeptide repeat (TPR)-containing protein [Striga asiatica]|uniref:Tetratricopeptide repeat (TPR)-containing protein n=1 Tax=Striga asiatica TaxID=4170 RepID=A0A5A7NXQ4_STRAF|nr:tetratricopeptide repeat (TPR)-containing protein [Striga asiatica]
MMERRQREAGWSSSHVTGVAAAAGDNDASSTRRRSELEHLNPVVVGGGVWGGDADLAVVEVVLAGVKVLPVLAAPEKHQTPGITVTVAGGYSSAFALPDGSPAPHCSYPSPATEILPLPPSQPHADLPTGSPWPLSARVWIDSGCAKSETSALPDALPLIPTQFLSCRWS